MISWQKKGISPGRIPKITSLVDMIYVNERNWNETGRNKDDVEMG